MWTAVLVVLIVLIAAGVAVGLRMRSRRRQRPLKIGLPDLDSLGAQDSKTRSAEPMDRAPSPKEEAVSGSSDQAGHALGELSPRSRRG